MAVALLLTFLFKKDDDISEFDQLGTRVDNTDGLSPANKGGNRLYPGKLKIFCGEILKRFLSIVKVLTE